MRHRKGMSAEAAARQKEAAARGDIPLGKMLRVRYFTDGAVIGNRSFVNEAFAKARDRFGMIRKDGARRMRGSGAAAAGNPVEREGFEEGNGVARPNPTTRTAIADRGSKIKAAVPMATEKALSQMLHA